MKRKLEQEVKELLRNWWSAVLSEKVDDKITVENCMGVWKKKDGILTDHGAVTFYQLFHLIFDYLGVDLQLVEKDKIEWELKPTLIKINKRTKQKEK